MLCHELGHYIIAYRLGWKPKLTIKMFWKMPALAVITRDVNIEINNTSQFMKWHFKLTAFSSVAILTSLLGTMILFYLGLLSVNVALMFVLIWSSYGVFELNQSNLIQSVEKKEDAI